MASQLRSPSSSNAADGPKSAKAAGRLRGRAPVFSHATRLPVREMAGTSTSGPKRPGLPSAASLSDGDRVESVKEELKRSRFVARVADVWRRHGVPGEPSKEGAELLRSQDWCGRARLRATASGVRPLGVPSMGGRKPPDSMDPKEGLKPCCFGVVHSRSGAGSAHPCALAASAFVAEGGDSSSLPHKVIGRGRRIRPAAGAFDGGGGLGGLWASTPPV